MSSTTNFAASRVSTWLRTAPPSSDTVVPTLMVPRYTGPSAPSTACRSEAAEPTSIHQSRRQAFAGNAGRRVHPGFGGQSEQLRGADGRRRARQSDADQCWRVAGSASTGTLLRVHGGLPILIAIGRARMLPLKDAA